MTDEGNKQRKNNQKIADFGTKSHGLRPYKFCKNGSVTALKYSVSSSGVSAMPLFIHHCIMSMKLPDIWFSIKLYGTVKFFYFMSENTLAV